MKNKRSETVRLHPDLLLLSDSALPTGGFSHSYGLETFVARGEKELKKLLETFITEELGKVDCPTFMLAYRAFDLGEPDRLIELDIMVNAMKIPREWREAGSQTGRRMLVIGETIAEVRSDITPPKLWVDYSEKVRSGTVPGQYPVIAGMLYCMLGIPLADAASAYAFSAVKNLVGAVVRLVPLGQTEGLKLQVSLNGMIATAVKEAMSIDKLDELGGFAPSFELAGIVHEQLYTRLFIS